MSKYSKILKEHGFEVRNDLEVLPRHANIEVYELQGRSKIFAGRYISRKQAVEMLVEGVK